MRIVRLAELMAYKYKIAGEAELLEGDIRRSIDQLWKLPNVQFNILKACAESGFKRTEDSNEEQMAERGFVFISKVVDTINQIKIKQKTMDMLSLSRKLKSLKRLISGSMEVGRRNQTNWPDLMALVSFVLDPYGKKKHDAKQEGGQWAKARTGLTKILSYVSDMLFEIKKYDLIKAGASKEEIAEAENQYKTYERPKLEAKRVPLNEDLIKSFLRQYGLRYGLATEQDWEVAFREDPEFKEDIHDVINALNRGRVAKNDAWVKQRIAEALADHEERKALGNQEFFDAPEQEAQQQLALPAQKEQEAAFQALTPAQQWSRQMQDAKQQKLQEQEEQPPVMSPQQMQDAIKQRDEEHAKRQEELQKQKTEEEMKSKYGTSRFERIFQRYQ